HSRFTTSGDRRWLSGSMAGICALLTFFGYLVTAAHLNLLGFNMSLFGFNAELYLQRGGNFVFYVVDALAQRIFLPLIVLCLIPLTLVLAISLFPETGKLLTWLRSAKERLQSWVGLQAQRLRIVASLMLILLLFVQLGPSLNNLFNPLKISGLLYETDEAYTHGRGDIIFNALAKQDSRILSAAFFNLLISMLLAGFYFLLIWHVTENLRFRAVIVAPFLIIFSLYLIFLPMNFGVMLIKSEYPEISFESTQSANGPQADLFLLNQTDKSLILWDSDGQKILLLPHGELGRAEIGRNRDILRKTIDRSCHESPNIHSHKN
ncbi:MAG: hypothetical protein ACU83O_15100, partial [Gammaproteobacteria bacterium]